MKNPHHIHVTWTYLEDKDVNSCWFDIWFNYCTVQTNCIATKRSLCICSDMININIRLVQCRIRQKSHTRVGDWYLTKTTFLDKDKKIYTYLFSSFLLYLFLKIIRLVISGWIAARCVNTLHLEKNALKCVIVRSTCVISSLDAQKASIICFLFKYIQYYIYDDDLENNKICFFTVMR